MNHADESTSSDAAALHDPHLARVSAIAGIASIALAPIVLGLFSAALGLHGARTHLRFREGSRGLAWFGAISSALGAILSASAALVWGSVLMTVLLQRSAVHQAQGWEGTSAGTWSLRDVNGVEHQSATLAGRIIFIDCFAPLPPCDVTTKALASFAAARTDVVVLSWSADADVTEAQRYARDCGVQHPLIVGAQSMPEPFSLIAAKPTLVVIDADGIIRNVVLGRYDQHDLAKLLDAANAPRVVPTQRNGGSGTSSSTRSTT